MKKTLSIIVTLICVLAFGAPVFALTLTATINPYWGGSYDGNATSGVARVDIFSDIAFDTGKLDFGTSPGVSFVTGTASIITPGTWVSKFAFGLLTSQIISSGANLPTTNHLAFTFSFDLIKPLNQMAAEVAAGTSAWTDFFHSAGPWQMNGSILLGPDNATFSTGLVPEPGTLILLGFGLLGLGLYGRRRRKS